MEHTLSVSLDEAMAHIADPYSLFGLPLARGICDAFAVAFPEHLVVHWTSRADAYRRYDAPSVRDEVGFGLLSVHLSTYIAACYGAPTPIRATRSPRQQVQINAEFLEKTWKVLSTREDVTDATL